MYIDIIDTVTRILNNEKLIKIFKLIWFFKYITLSITFLSFIFVNGYLMVHKIIPSWCGFFNFLFVLLFILFLFLQKWNVDFD